MIEAFHSNWTAPFLRANPNKNYYIDDFEILTTIISALKWRENNGSIKMITDDIAADYYKKLGLDEHQKGAIGILTITPAEGTIIAADIASKAASIDIGFIDRFSGALLITGDVASVESALSEIINGLFNILNFAPTTITRT